ncbi:NnrS family protein [Tianweitania sediminis]|uniref:NnrS family protein n=1 Tax=Tianweitania sediminis TaxID=1502156 RepID=UPI001FD7D42B|nr:NnrS family protein [Tianweitania sediminis]
MGGAPVWSYGFRPFFLLGALYAALIVPFWVWAHASGYVLHGPFSGSVWHAHEMLFGFLSAVIAGFVLTAVPNWTGRLPLSGTRLAVLVLLWLIGRIACATVAAPWVALPLDMLFPVSLALAIWREVLVGRNLRNIPVAALLSFFALAGALHHLEANGIFEPGLPVRLALGVITLLMALIGGRIIPSFTRNWLVKQGSRTLPAPFGFLDGLALATTLSGVLAWIIVPQAVWAAALLLIAGTFLIGRLLRWKGWLSWREPILAVLHLGYLWLAAGVAMLGASILWPGLVPADAAIHTLTAGAVGTMTLSVMTRASLGHTGRLIASDRITTLIYAAVSLGALLRVLAPMLPDAYGAVIIASGSVWTFAFLLFAIRYGPILWRPREGA